MAIQIRRGTESEWEAGKSNIVAGEPCVTTDTGRFFVGTADGEYTEMAKAEELESVKSDIVEINETLDSLPSGGGESVGILVCGCTYDEAEGMWYLDKTWSEINHAHREGTLVIFLDTTSTEGEITTGFLTQTHTKPDPPGENPDLNYFLATFVTAYANSNEAAVWNFWAENADDILAW